MMMILKLRRKNNKFHLSLFVFTIILIMMKTTALSMSISSKKTALVTGSTDGIGVTTAKNLALKGYNVIIHGRNSGRIQKAFGEVRSFADKSENNNEVYMVEADISSVNGCHSLVRSVQSILTENKLSLDVLMNNAGVFEEDYQVTEDGLEMTFAVNVMAPFVITSNLLQNLLEEKKHQSRIVIASSISQCYSINNWDDLQFNRRPFSSHRAYSESKLFDAMLAAEFATLLEDAGVSRDRITCNSLDPGTVNTKMLLAGWGPCGIKVKDALDQTWLCTSDEVADITGSYFNYRSLSKYASSYSPSDRKKLWSILSEIEPASADKWDIASVYDKQK